jgi:hypothetical protein
MGHLSENWRVEIAHELRTKQYLYYALVLNYITFIYLVLDPTYYKHGYVG